MRIASVLALCAVGAVVALLLLRPAGDRPGPVPPVAPVAFDSAGLASALADRARELRVVQAVGSGQLDTLLAQDPLDLAIPRVTASGVTAEDVVVRRRGEEAAVEATVDPAELARLAPAQVGDLRLDERASRGDQIVLTGTAQALGFRVPVTVRVHVSDGAVVAEPQGLPVGAIVLFDDPRVHVDGLRVTPLDDGRLRVRATATVTASG